MVFDISCIATTLYKRTGSGSKIINDFIITYTIIFEKPNVIGVNVAFNLKLLDMDFGILVFERHQQKFKRWFPRCGLPSTGVIGLHNNLPIARW